MIRKALDRHLRLRGCILNHHESLHEVWVNPKTLVHASLPRHTTIKDATAKAICKVLSIAAPAGE
jgi:hypothetical protein